MFNFKCKQCANDLEKSLVCDNCHYLNLFSVEFNFFAILGFEDIMLKMDQNELEKKYLETLAKYHPDKFVNANEEVKQNAFLLAAKINEAYTTLKKDSSRLMYIYELLFKEKIETQDIISSTMEEEFFQIHETIQATKNKEELEQIKQMLIQKRQKQLRKVSTHITNKEKHKIAVICNYLRYIDKTIEIIEK